GFARAQGTDRDGEMQYAPGYHHFNLSRYDTHPQGTPHQVLEGVFGLGAEQEFQGVKIVRGSSEHAGNRGIGAKDCAIGVQGDHASGNVFQHGFHQLAAALEFLNGLLQVACELIDLRAVIAQLRGHGIEGAHQHTEFVLHLLRHLIPEIAGGNFARALGKRLNGHGDLFGEEEGDPGGGGKNEHGKEKEDQEHLALERAQVLFLDLVFLRLRLDGVPAPHEVGAGAIGGDEGAGVFGVEGDRNARGKVTVIAGLPDFDAAGQDALLRAHGAVNAAKFLGTVLILVVTRDATEKQVALGIEDPNRGQPSGKGMLEERVGRFTEVRGGLIAKGVQTGQSTVAKVVEELLRFFGGNFERAGKPASQRTVQQGIAGEKHEDDRQQRNGHGAHDHLGFEARAKLLFAAFGPQAYDAARQDETKDKQ